jgi:hypothetical protein
MAIWEVTGEITGWSLALIGNASGRTVEEREKS